MQDVRPHQSPWQDYPATYRAEEITTLLRWIAVGASGAVVGLRGVGRSNLLGFLCYRPDLLQPQIERLGVHVVLVPVNLDDLPSKRLTDLYRVILRSFYEVSEHFGEALQTFIIEIYQRAQTLTDPFLTQSALRQWLLRCQQVRVRIVLVIDRFDTFCHMLTPPMARALGALYDAFRDTVQYIVGIRQSLTYITDLALDDDLYRLFTTHLYFLGPLKEEDARYSIARRTQVSAAPPTEDEIQMIVTLTGGYPTLVKAICRWWLLEATPPPPQWLARLAALPAIGARLQGIWSGLTQEEQLALTALVKGNLSPQGASLFQQRHQEVLGVLAAKGICRPQGNTWSIFSSLFADFVAQVGSMSRGRIWLDPATASLYHGPQPIQQLTPKEYAILHFLVKAPGVRHSYTDVIVNVWSDEENYHGVTNDSLFQVIKGLRRKIEPNPAQPVYVMNWRGKPEGGYIFYPEGRPT